MSTLQECPALISHDCDSCNEADSQLANTSCDVSFKAQMLNFGSLIVLVMQWMTPPTPSRSICWEGSVLRVDLEEPCPYMVKV